MPQSCRHLQAEPVILSTGELVACVCIACWLALPAEYIQQQLRRAWHEGACSHEDTVAIYQRGSTELVRVTCTECAASDPAVAGRNTVDPHPDTVGRDQQGEPWQSQTGSQPRQGHASNSR